MAKYNEYFNKELIISPYDAQKLIGNNDYIFIDVRKKSEYESGHIKGSINIERKELESTNYPYIGMRLEKENLALLLSKKGITNDKMLVLYDGRANYDSARLWWMLYLYGFTNVKLIDGGINGWNYYRLPLSHDSIELESRTFYFNNIENNYINADINEVVNAIDNEDIVILDTRELSEYNGSEKKDGAYRSGRIPGSKWINYSEAINLDGDFGVKTYDELINIYGELQDKEIIAYCQAGIRSAYTTLILKELLGFENVKNYDGSWIEWSYNKQLPIENDSYDLIIIGGGSAGLTAASEGARIGKKIALIEKNKTLGGDCLHSGCVPSKALISAAKEGISFNDAIKRIKEVKAAIQKHDSIERFEALGVEVFISRAYLKNKNTVLLENKSKLTGKNILICTGSSPKIPKVEGIECVRYHTNETVFDMKSLPETLAVIGGGPIGCELAQAFSKFGTKVYLLEYLDSILNSEDEEIRELISNHLSKEIAIITNSRIEKVCPDGDKINLYYTKENNKNSIVVDEILFAAGRKNNTENLGLEDLGVEVEYGFINADEKLKTSVDNVFIAGDVTGKYQFTHAAAAETKVVISNLFKNENRIINYSNIPWTIFTSPEIYHIGETEKEARKKHDDIIVLKSEVNNLDRFITDNKQIGCIKVIAKADGTILGAHAAGEHAGEWMQLMGLAKTLDIKLPQLEYLVIPYPTFSSAIEKVITLYRRSFTNVNIRT